MLAKIAGSGAALPFDPSSFATADMVASTAFEDDAAEGSTATLDCISSPWSKLIMLSTANSPNPAIRFRLSGPGSASAETTVSTRVLSLLTGVSRGFSSN